MENEIIDEILIDRLAEFFPIDSWAWNEGETVGLDDIAAALHNKQSEEPEPYGDHWNLSKESRTKRWHIGRVLYFIKHPDEIRDIEIDNVCDGMDICPIPIIVDGNHRFIAAMYLSSQGKMDRVYCRYGGRMDLLDYLIGKTDVCPCD